MYEPLLTTTVIKIPPAILIQTWKVRLGPAKNLSWLELHISWFFNFLSGNGKNDQFPGREIPGNQENSLLEQECQSSG